jgi:hypothetical protein
MGGEKKAEYDKFWGGEKVKGDRFKIVDERQLEQKIQRETTTSIVLSYIMLVYKEID